MPIYVLVIAILFFPDELEEFILFVMGFGWLVGIPVAVMLFAVLGGMSGGDE